MQYTKYLIVLLILLVSSCWPIDEFGEPIFPEGEIEGFMPVYGDELDLEISYEGPRPITFVGQILSINNIVLFIDQGQGIHIVDNTNLEQPQKLGFLKMNGVQQLTLRNGVLYASQYTDLVAIDLSDINNIQVINREEGILIDDAFSNQAPPSSGYFICPDPEKGQVVAWEFGMIESPKCYK